MEKRRNLHEGKNCIRVSALRLAVTTKTTVMTPGQEASLLAAPQLQQLWRLRLPVALPNPPAAESRGQEVGRTRQHPRLPVRPGLQLRLPLSLLRLAKPSKRLLFSNQQGKPCSFTNACRVCDLKWKTFAPLQPKVVLVIQHSCYD